MSAKKRQGWSKVRAMRRLGLPVLSPAQGPGPLARPVVLRKEVIQPQVLLRLPCYDLVPITGFAFGAFLPDCSGLDERLRAPPAFMA